LFFFFFFFFCIHAFGALSTYSRHEQTVAGDLEGGWLQR
jgi:hypothetical protein